MKIGNRIKSTLINLTRSVERFPLTVALSGLLAVLMIIYNESISKLSTAQLEDFSRVNMTVGLSVLASICIGLFIERFYYKDRLKSVVSYVLGGLALLLYHYTLLPSFDFVPITRFVALVFILIISFFFIPWLKKDHFEIYVIKVFSGLLTTWIYSMVLYFGLSAILFTTNTLFDLEIDNKYYYYIFLIVGLIFAVALFLSKIPGREEDLEKYTYSKSLKVLLLYIVIPLISVYTMILYAYFAKILFTWQWPKGLVSNLVLWYSSISVGIIFLITPILEENKVGKMFKTWFPKVILPILAMMFASIGLRINQYGITENRYYIVLLGIWVTGIMLCFSLVKPLKNSIIPITLSLTLIIAVFGPLSGYSLSIKSQSNRFNDILVENNMLKDGQIVKNKTLSEKGKKELSNILSYFDNSHEFSDLSVLPDDFTLSKTETVFGFVHSPQYGIEEQQYFYQHLDLYNTPIPIDGYDYFININTYDVQQKTVGTLTYQYNVTSHEFNLKEGNKTLLSKNILDYVEEIYDKTGHGGKEVSSSIEEMSFTEETEDLKIKFIFTNVNGRNNPDTNQLTFEGGDFILLIQYK